MAILLLTLISLAILSASNPPTILLNSPNNNTNNLKVTTKSNIGDGNQVNTLLYITNNYNNTLNATSITSNIYFPPYAGLASLMFFGMTQQDKSFMLYLLLGVAVCSVVVATIAAYRLLRKHMVSIKVLASLENIIIDHTLSGVTIWEFDFLRMNQDVGLLSGFMSAVRSFLDEMKEGGLRKLETEFRMLIRENGEFLTATCIARIQTSPEEEWIRQRLRRFLLDAEQQHRKRLENWMGCVTPFKASFMRILATVIDLDKAERLQMEKLFKILRDKERLQEELSTLNSQLEKLNQQLGVEEINEKEFEARKTEIELYYDHIQNNYDETSLLLSRAPSTPRTKLITTVVTRETGKYAKHTPLNQNGKRKITGKRASITKTGNKKRIEKLAKKEKIMQHKKILKYL
jgi:hypothetical protein